MKGGFVMLPRNVLEGDAWRSLGINARRLLDFLMIEHMRHGGKCNGFLLAPQRQLYEFGVGAHFVTAAIDEVERGGLVTCERGVGKRPSYYGLTWLPPGSPPVVPAVSTNNACYSAGTRPVAPAKQQATRPNSLPAKQQAPSRRLYHGGAVDSVVEGKGESVGQGHGVAAAVAGRPSSGKPNGRAAP
jgi:hypothetical protein